MGETTSFLRRRSWKTSIAGLLTAAGVAMKKHPATAPWSEVVEMAGVTLLGLAAADHRKDKP